ncbi:MAG: hypothetical protein AAF249_15325 [Pseudomonadota bacterium]
MTACAHVKRKGLPAIFADSVITWDGVDLEAMALPGSLVHARRGMPFAPNPIAKKLYVPHPELAVSCAGETEFIAPFLDTFHSNIDLYLRHQNPLEPIFTMLAEYEHKIETLVSWFSERGGGCIRKQVGGSSSLLEEVSTIGSGGEGLDGLIRGHDARLTWRAKQFNLTPYDVIVELFSQVNSSLVGNDLLFGRPRDWGGFGEWVYYNPAKRQWDYGPSHLQVFVLGVPLSAGRFTLELSRYVVQYVRPTTTNPSFVSALDFSGEHKTHTWIFESILASARVKSPSLITDALLQPEEICFQIFPYCKRELGSIFNCFPCKADYRVVCNVEGGHLNFAVDPDLIDEWGRAVSKVWKREYVPLRSISDDEATAAFQSARAGGWD